MKDGVIDLYLEAERINRKKYSNSIKSLLHLITCDIDVIAVADAYWDKPSKELQSVMELRKVIKMFPKAKVYDYRHLHHKCHAACAWYRSGFDDAVAIVVDANGSKINRIETETMYELPSWNVIHKKYFDEQDVGIGKEFELCCIRHGWHHMDAGKVMGKASYGPSDCYRVQKRWEARALELAKLTDKDLVLVGGCFLNCTVNYMLKKKLGRKIYVEPISTDGGTSIGAAYLAKAEHT
jgi:carbamoyltransferase